MDRFCRSDGSEDSSGAESKLGKKEAMMVTMREGVRITKRHKEKINAGALSVESISAGRNSKIEPLIIHTVSPPVLNVDPSSFMQIVQSLTGSEETRLRLQIPESKTKSSSRSAAVPPRSCSHLLSRSSLPLSTLSALSVHPPLSGETPSTCVICDHPCGSSNSTPRVDQLMSQYPADLHVCSLEGLLRLKDCNGKAACSTSGDAYDNHTDLFQEQKSVPGCSSSHSGGIEPCLPDFQNGLCPSPSTETDTSRLVSCMYGEYGAMFTPGNSSPQGHEQFSFLLSDSPLSYENLTGNEDSYFQQLLFNDGTSTSFL
ncbi:hypothetical protein KP509_22G013600 [Ceratopteris richardii]|uniref:VQ domain-containing protein n=1 Tax=Ceratopteris richardii TaxID=49495 RepID=A0A8T2S3Q3_CERRI|nr:hypothetical protein KP509_22G013600 [Ceratopteris richardii]